jgi:hypothetical protein
MLSEYLTQQYEQIEDMLDSNHKSIAQQEKDQGKKRISGFFFLFLLLLE